MKRRINRRDFLNGSLVSMAGIAGRRFVPSASFRPIQTTVDTWNLPPATGGFNPYSDCHRLMGGGSWDIPEPSGALFDCVIIGGGISGLAAAWRLKKYGAARILLLEKNDRTGGQCRSIGEEGGLIASQGSAYASIPYTPVLTELYEDLGVVLGQRPDGSPIIDPEYLLKRPWARHHLEGAWHADPWESEEALDALPYPGAVKDDFRSLREIVEWWWNFEGNDGKPAFALPISGASEDPDVLWLDGLTLAEYLRWEGLDSRVAEFFDPLLKSVYCLDSSEVSAYVGVDFLTSEILPGEVYESVLCRPGGNAWVADGIARMIGRDVIQCNRFVLRAVNAGDEVHVTFLEDGVPMTIRSRTAISAFPRMMASSVLPDLGPGGTTPLNYGAYLVANIHVLETPANLAYANEVHGDFFFTDFTVADWAGLDDPVNAPLDRPNILTIYAPQTGWDARSRLLSTPIEAFEERIFADLERVLPGIGDVATGFDLFRWGHPMVLTRPGFVFSEERRAAAQGIGKIFSAGHETEGIPYIDTAITAGVRAAEEASRLIPLPAPRKPAGRAG